ncbi:hypothetical protein LCGC14_2014970 [marine sediment metagenome]|uniref:Uncharacterized protein n=1 Tax=marine sediment metagenome TaxID=412755 RepID=A0A0F9EZE1_9ZZZZ
MNKKEVLDLFIKNWAKSLNEETFILVDIHDEIFGRSSVMDSIRLDAQKDKMEIELL